MLWWPLTRDLIIKRKTIAESTTPPAIAPNIIPANAPLLILELDDGVKNTAITRNY